MALRQTKTTPHSGKTWTFTFGSATAAGSLLLLKVATFNNSGTTFFTPTTPTGWTLVKSTTTGTPGLFVYAKGTAASISSVALTTSATSGTTLFWSVTFEEWPTFKATTDGTPGATHNASSTTNVTTVTSTTAITELIAVFCVSGSGTNPTTMTCSGYTLTSAETNGATWITVSGFYKISTATGTQTATVTLPVAAENTGIMIVFKKKTGGGGSVTATVHAATGSGAAESLKAALAPTAVKGAGTGAGKALSATEVAVAGAALGSGTGENLTGSQGTIAIPATATGSGAGKGLVAEITAYLADAAGSGVANNLTGTVPGVGYTVKWVTSNVAGTPTGNKQVVTLKKAGDLVIVTNHIWPSGSESVTFMSDSANAITWNATASVHLPHTGSKSGQNIEIWTGVVKAGKTTVTTTITAHYSGSGGTFDEFIYCAEIAPPSSYTGAVTWHAGAAGYKDWTTSSGSVMTTTGLKNGARLSFAWCWFYTNTAATNVGSAGTTAGATYTITPTYFNVLGWITDVVNTRTVVINANQSHHTSAYAVVGALFYATTTGGGSVVATVHAATGTGAGKNLAPALVAPEGVGTGMGSGENLTASFAFVAQVATATGSGAASNAKVALGPNLTHAAGTGTGQNLTGTGGGSKVANVQTATGTGQAFGLKAASAPAVGPATGSGVGINLTVSKATGRRRGTSQGAVWSLGWSEGNIQPSGSSEGSVS